jgi:hypothetical protein
MMITTETKFTPGPWVAERVLAPASFVIVNSDGQRLALNFDKRGSFPQAEMDGHQYLYEGQAEANASLIAAAPELYAELTEARTTLSILRTQVMVEIGRCPDPSESRWEGVPEKLKDRLDAIDAALAKATAA